jgi:hypothetical protein
MSLWNKQRPNLQNVEQATTLLVKRMNECNNEKIELIRACKIRVSIESQEYWKEWCKDAWKKMMQKWPKVSDNLPSWISGVYPC